MRRKFQEKQIFCFALVITFLGSSCTFLMVTKKGRIIGPHDISSQVEWTKEELEKEVALRNLRDTQEASFYLIRLSASERPHTHDFHDLVVFVLEGEGLVHLTDKTFKVKPGDVIEIPRGVVHWAEIIDNKPCVVYAIFTPPLEGPDQR